MKKQTTSLWVFFRKDRIRADGTTQLIMRVSIDSHQFKIPLGEYVKPEQWNREKQEVKRADPDHQDKNLVVGLCTSKAMDIFRVYRLREIRLTEDIFRHEYTHEASRRDFLEYFRMKIKSRIKHLEIEESTGRQHEVVYRKIKNFFGGKLLFSSISTGLIKDFDQWHLQELIESEGENLINNGNGPRSNALKIIKTYLNLAQVDDVDFPMPTISSRQYSGDAIYLSQQEVYGLLDLYESGGISEEEKSVLRCFLFCCFTGPHFTDAQKLKWDENIHGDMLKYERQKLKKKRVEVTVPLIPQAIVLLGEPKASGHVFSQLTGQHTNRVLKVIAKRVGIKKKLSTKVARHTFGTLFAEMSGGDVFTLMELMGHSKVETTRKYVHLSPGHKKRQMEVFRQEFERMRDGE